MSIPGPGGEPAVPFFEFDYDGQQGALVESRRLGLWIPAQYAEPEDFLPPRVELNLSDIPGFDEARMGRIEALEERSIRVATITDRMPFNVRSLWDESFLTGSNSNKELLGIDLTGVIAVGGELDRYGEITNLKRAYEATGGEIIDSPVVYEDPDNPDVDVFTRDHLFLFGNGLDRDRHVGEFRYYHVGYDGAQLRDDEYRLDFAKRLIESTKGMAPQVLLLDNLKVIMPPEFLEVLEAQGSKVLNLHPSYLPLNKGWRPEIKAYRGENPEAFGWTLHEVATQLDSGAVIYAQKMTWPGELDEATRRAIYGDLYETNIEEALRAGVIWDQSQVIPLLIRLYGSPVPRQVVTDEAAFAAEGRPDFMNDHAYRKERTAMEAKGEDPTYRRLLFDVGSGMQTAEEIIGVQDIIESVIKTGFRAIEFEMPMDKTSLEKLGKLIDQVKKAGMIDSGDIQLGEGSMTVTIVGAADNIPDILNDFGIDEIRQVPLLSRANAPRVPIPETRVPFNEFLVRPPKD